MRKRFIGHIGLMGLMGFIGLSSVAYSQIIGYDDFGRKIVLQRAPKRIVCVSATHIPTIFSLGAGDRIVGVSDYVVRQDTSYPELVKKYPALLKKQGVGGFSDPNIEKIISLNPDLVIIFDSSDTSGKYSRIFEERKITFAAFTTAKDIESGLSQIKKLGILLGKEKEAEKLYIKLKKEIEQLTKTYSKRKNPPLVWWYWGTGAGTYGKKAVIDELIRCAGGINLASDFDRQWFELSFEYVIAKDPDVIIIACWKEEDYKTRVKALKDDPRFANLSAVKNNRVYSLNGHHFFSPIKYPEVIKKMGELFK